MLNGVVFGENYTGNKVAGRERYTHKNLGITFTYPQDWSQIARGKSIVLKDANKTIQLKIVIEKTVDKSKSSKQVLAEKYPDDLSKVEALQAKASRDLGTMARRPQQRVAVIQVGRNTYFFQGIAKNNVLTDAQDQLFIAIIKSFRRASRKDLPAETVKTIYYERLKPGQSFTSLIKEGELGIYTEDYLRLMNGYYPKGEPEPGMWIKLVRSDPLPNNKK
jgi:predicted Zn-dependent protease